MTNEEKIIKNKVGLLKLAEELGNVSQACQIMGYSREGFYRFRELYNEHGSEGLREISRKKPIPLNRVALEVEEAVVKIATDYRLALHHILLKTLLLHFLHKEYPNPHIIPK